jgi:hypothetical protein
MRYFYSAFVLKTRNDMEKLIQNIGVGRVRELDCADSEQIVCLLRIIERLPILTSEIAATTPPEQLLRKMECIHSNHIELAGYAAELLSNDSFSTTNKDNE